MTGFKFHIPKIAALEMGEDGLFNRIEYVCGCVTIRKEIPIPMVAQVVWSWVERCDLHVSQKITLGAIGKLPEWIGP